jgi:hypothetical protein
MSDDKVILGYFWFFWYMIASLGSVWLQNSRVVSDCKNYFLCVIAKLLVYFCDCKKKKELNQCVIATIWRVWLQLGVMCGCKTWLCLCGWKATWLLGIWLQAWVVCDCKNYFLCVIAKTVGLFLWLQKEKKNWTSVWLKLFGVRDCNQELCVVAKPNCVYVVEKLLGYLVYDCKPG